LDAYITPIICQEEERNILLTILSVLLRNILEDPTVIQSFAQTGSEQIPLYNNFRTTVPSAHLNRLMTCDGQLKSEPATDEKRESKTEKEIEKQLEAALQEKQVQAPTNEEPRYTNDHDVQEEKDTIPGVEQMKQIKEQEDGNVEKISFSEPPSTRLMNELLKTDSMEQQSAMNEDEEVSPLAPAPPVCPEAKPERDSFLMDEIKTMPDFGSFLEDILASTLGNILEEALHGEVLLTARPRVVALPPCYAPINNETTKRPETAELKMTAEFTDSRLRTNSRKESSRKQSEAL